MITVGDESSDDWVQSVLTDMSPLTGVERDHYSGNAKQRRLRKRRVVRTSLTKAFLKRGLYLAAGHALGKMSSAGQSFNPFALN